MTTLNIIIASTRPGRAGPKVAKWFHEYAKAHGKFDAVLVDLAEHNFPVYNEAKHPRLQQYEHEHTKKWSKVVAAADAYVFVTPEYNYGPPPSLINALDYVYAEWNYKPAGIVSYGGVSGGLRAAQTLKLQLGAQKMVTPPEGVPIPNFTTMIGEDGVFKPIELVVTSAKTMLDELSRWAEALKPMRAK